MRPDFAPAVPVSPPPFVSDRPDHRSNRHHRADDGFQVGCLELAFGDECRAGDGEDLTQQRLDGGCQHGLCLLQISLLVEMYSPGIMFARRSERVPGVPERVMHHRQCGGGAGVGRQRHAVTTLAFKATARAVMVAANLALILTWLPVAPEATKGMAVPLIVNVLFTAGCAEKVINPVAATVPAVVGAPNAAFSQKPKPTASIGTSTSPSVVIASSSGARGSRP